MTERRAGIEKLGIMGGTFDPIHNGHLFVAEEARGAEGLDRVLFVPSGTPPHKRYAGMADAEARYDMVRLAVRGNPHFDVSRIETDRRGRSYTLDTLQEMSALYPDSRIYFITGDDAVLDMLNWHEPYEIARMATLLTVGRPGYARDKISELPQEIRGSIRTIDSPQLDLSSTDIRRRVRAGRSIRYMVPEDVRRYIDDNALYTDSDGELH